MIFILLAKQSIITKKDNFTVKLSFEFCTSYNHCIKIDRLCQKSKSKDLLFSFTCKKNNDNIFHMSKSVHSIFNPVVKKYKHLL